MFEPLPALIRMERERQGLTLDALAALANVSRSRLAAIEKGDDNVSLKTLLKVANTLKMTHLQIGGLHIEAAAPEVAVLLAAADGLDTARKVIQQASASQEDLDRASESVAQQLARIIRPVPPAGGRRPAKPDAGLVAEALRELADAPDAPPPAPEKRPR